MMWNQLYQKSGRLGIKLLGPFLLISLVTILSASLAAVFSYNTQLRYTQQVQQEVADQAATSIEEFVQRIQDTLRHGAQHLVEEDNATDEALSILQSIKANSPALYELAFLDTEGREQAKIIGLMPVPSDRLQNRHADDAFLTAMKGHDYIGPVYISPFEFPFATFAVPIFNRRQQVVGVLAAEVDVSQVWNIITNIANKHRKNCPSLTASICSTTVYVVDRQGHLIAINSNTARTRGLPNLAQVSAPIPQLTDRPIEGVIAFMQGDFSPATYTGIQDETGQQETVVGVRAPVTNTDWGVIVERPRRIVSRQASYFALGAILLIAVVGILMIGTGMYVVKNIIQPLQTLQRGAARLAQGDFTHVIKIATGDEIEDLANEFNNMAINLFESQQSLADAAEENAQLYRDEQRRARELALVNQINQTVLASLDVETTIDAVLRNLRTLLDYQGAEINLWDAETQSLRAHVVGDTAYTARAGHRYTLQQGYTGWLARHRTPLLLPDVDHPPEDAPRPALPDFPFKSYIGLPMLVGEEFLGTLELVHSQPNTYTKEDVASLQMLVGQAAVAIRHAQVFQESQERAHAQEQLASIASLAATTLHLDDLLRGIMTRTVETLGAEKGFVLLLNKEETELYPPPAGAVGFPPEIVATFRIPTNLPEFSDSVLATGRIFQSHNARTDRRILPLYRPFIEQLDITTVVVVPLTTADKNVGELYLLNKPTPFTSRDVTFLSAVAVHFASAIQNATLFEATQHSLHELSILYQSVADLSSTLSVEEILSNLGQRMVSILPAEECAISRLDEESGLLETLYQNATISPPYPAHPLSDAPRTADILRRV
ncbi:MAG: GAF domain-containing protein, partial [Caldilineae bacterium]